MNKPAIMVLDDKPDGLDTLERALRHRYEHDYLIISHTSAAAALGHLAELAAAGRPVAVVLAASTLAAASGTEFLATVRAAQPAAKRVLIVPRGGTAAPSLRVPAPLLLDRSAAQPAAAPPGCPRRCTPRQRAFPRCCSNVRPSAGKPAAAH